MYPIFLFLGLFDGTSKLLTRKQYINHQGNPFSPTKSSALHLASYFDLPFLVSIYLSLTTCPSPSPTPNSIHAICTTGDTPLLWASETGATSCIKLLLSAGADPNIVEYDGWSPLHWAARNGHVDTAELLLQSGAELEARDSKGSTPEDWALGRGHCDVANLLETWRRNKMETARASLEQVIKRVVEKQVREREKKEVSLITCRSWEVMQENSVNEDVDSVAEEREASFAIRL